MNYKKAFYILLAILIAFLVLEALVAPSLYYLDQAKTPEDICKHLAWGGDDFAECMRSFREG